MTIKVKYQETIGQVHNQTQEWIVRDIKADIERIIGEALKVEVDDEGEWQITDSSVKMAVDDILTHYDVKEREL